jgi:CRP-like cAMP-binding protein
LDRKEPLTTPTKSVRLQPSSPSKSGSNGVRDKSLQNAILLALPPKDTKSLLDLLEWVDLPTHTSLQEAGEVTEFGYFINGGLASILNVMANGKSVEVGLSGKEGFIGVGLIVGFKTSPSRVVMQVAGDGFRVRARDLPDILGKWPRLEKLLQRYSQALMMQAAQIAACNRLHEVDQRLARWLLMSQDRLGGDDVPLTQQFLAHMLGTRRASVTVAARSLQEGGSIAYKRGHVKITGRLQLERASCECYQKMNSQSQKWEREIQ